MKMSRLTVAASALALGLSLTGAAMAQDTPKTPDPSAPPPVQTPDPATATSLPATPQDMGATVDTPTGPTREVDTPPHRNSAAGAAQLKREHLRAIKAGDKANDPYSSESSDALNKAQLAKAQAMGNAPTAYPDQAVQGEGVAADPGATPADQMPQPQAQPGQSQSTQPDTPTESKSPQ